MFLPYAEPSRFIVPIMIWLIQECLIQEATYVILPVKRTSPPIRWLRDCGDVKSNDRKGSLFFGGLDCNKGYLRLEIRRFSCSNLLISNLRFCPICLFVISSLLHPSSSGDASPQRVVKTKSVNGRRVRGIHSLSRCFSGRSAGLPR